VGEITANALNEAGFTSAKEVAETNLEELMQATGLHEKKARTLMAAAQEMMTPEGEEAKEASDTPGSLE
jgi:transcription termination factor NusA